MSKYTPFFKPQFGKPPPGYIPGLGRGAMGFVTNNELTPSTSAVKTTEDLTANYDSWTGYDVPVFRSDIIDQQDKQADLAYKFVQKRLAERNPKRAQQPEPKKIQSISDNYQDLKRELSCLRENDWLTIPDAVDRSVKKKKREKTTYTPDNLLQEVMSRKESTKVVQSGIRSAVLKSSLDLHSNSIGGQSVVDKLGYISQLDQSKPSSFIGDPERARLLYRSAYETNPQNAFAWIGAARIQQLQGKYKRARQLLSLAIEKCPNNQDIWLQAIRIQTPETSALLQTKAVARLPNSQKLWLNAVQSATDKTQKTRLLRKAIEANPTQTLLWKKLIDLQEPQAAKKLLQKAVECLPKQLDLWLAFAKLADYKEAKSILNRARKQLPSEPAVWLSACELQQSQNSNSEGLKEKLKSFLRKAKRLLNQEKAMVKRGEWLQLVKGSQKRKRLLTVECVLETLFAEEIDQLQVQVLFHEAQRLFLEGFRSCGESLLKSYLDKKKIDDLTVQNLLQTIHSWLPQKALAWIQTIREKTKSPTLWNKACRGFYKKGALDQALSILQKSPTLTAQLIILKAKILRKKGLESQSEQFLRQSFQRLHMPEVRQKLCWWMLKQQKIEEGLLLLQHPVSTKQHVIKALLLQHRDLQAAQVLLQKTMELSFDQFVVYHYVSFLVRHRKFVKARPCLLKAVHRFPKNFNLFVLSIRIEQQANNHQALLLAIAKAFRQFAQQPYLWALSIQHEQPVNRMRKANQAVDKFGSESAICRCIGKIFWREGKLQKAQRWLLKAVEVNKNDVDSLGLLHLFNQRKQGEQSPERSLQNRLKDISRGQGACWEQIKLRGVSKWKAWPELLEKLKSQIA